jgi:hypothetical protein
LILLLITSLLLPLTGGVLLTFLFHPPMKSGAAGFAFRLCAGGGLGLGVASCLYFICLQAGLTRYLPAVDLGVCLLLGIPCFILFRRNAGRERPVPEPAGRSRIPLLLAGIFSVELIASATSFVSAYLKEPHGRWDAWLIWNMHARFLFRGGDSWRDAFASGLDWSHWDYPLLLPLSIARGWQYIGGEGLAVPAIIAFLLTFMTLGLLWSALSLLRSRTHGYLAAMVLMGTPLFIAMGASQFADIPLAFFMLATLALLSLPARIPENHPGPLILAGLAAGLCAWTKNEGLLFFAAVTVSLFSATVPAAGWRQACRRTSGLLAGALPVLLIVIWFKTQLSPANDLLAGFGPAAVAAKLTDFGRYAETAKAFFITGISFTQGLVDVRTGMKLNPGAVSILLLIGYLFLAGIRIEGRDRPGLIQSAAILGLMLIGYFFVYVLTPLDLGYHLATSLNRLFLQLWPGVIFLCFMIAGSPDPSPGDQPGTRSGPPETGSPRGANKRKAGKPK